MLSAGKLQSLLDLVQVSAPPTGTAVNRGRHCCQSELFWYKVGVCCSLEFLSRKMRWLKDFK